MTTTTLTKAPLLEKLADLEIRFAALSPELELTVRDPELGVEGYVVVWTTFAAEGGPLGRFGKGGRVSRRRRLLMKSKCSRVLWR